MVEQEGQDCADQEECQAIHAFHCWRESNIPAGNEGREYQRAANGRHPRHHKPLKERTLPNCMHLFELKGVNKKFGSHAVLDKVTFAIEEGEILGIVGTNGSGKTTLLKLLIGYYSPDSGSIFYRGEPLRKMKRTVQKEVGFTAQESSFYPQLTVEENITYFCSLYGLNTKETEEHTQRMLAFFDLLTVRHQIAQQLSGGMQRRLEMACSLVHDPKLLILDEPTEDLDPLLRRDILNLIKKVNELGTTIVITSHLLGDVEELCDRIAVLNNGKVVKVGSVAELREAYGGKEVIHLQTGSGHYETLIRDLQLQQFYVDGSKLVIYTDEAEKMLHGILHVLDNENDKLLYLDVRKPSLQEVFEEITDKRWL